MRSLVAIGCVAVALGVVGCGGGGDSADAGPVDAPRYTEDSLEYKMAVIDKDGYVNPDDVRLLDRYRYAIDGIRMKCTGSRVRIADQVVAVQQSVERGGGGDEYVLLIDHLRNLRKVAAELDRKQDCTRIFAAYASLQIPG